MLENFETTPDSFVDFVYENIYLGAISGSVSLMNHPPGGRPAPRLVELSDWFHTLGDLDRTMLTKAIGLAADSAIFSFLCVLDNVKAITDGHREEVKLKIISGTTERDLVPEGSYEELHGFFRSLVDEGLGRDE
jgi:hypothetical protein